MPAGRAREHAHAAFSKAVGRIIGHRPVLVHRGDIDDATAAALLDHLLGCDLRAKKGALEIDGQNPVVLILGCVEDRSAGFNASIVHHDVQPTELAYRRIDELLQVRELAYIRIDANGPIAEPTDLPLERLGRLRMDHVVDDDARLLPGEFKHDRLADPAVAAGDDGNLVLQRHDQPLNSPSGRSGGCPRGFRVNRTTHLRNAGDRRVFAGRRLRRRSAARRKPSARTTRVGYWTLRQSILSFGATDTAWEAAAASLGHRLYSAAVLIVRAYSAIVQCDSLRLVGPPSFGGPWEFWFGCGPKSRHEAAETNWLRDARSGVTSLFSRLFNAAPAVPRAPIPCSSGRILICLTAVLVQAVSAVVEPLPRSVLIIDQSDTNSVWYHAFPSAFRSTLNAGSTARISVYTEHLDRSRFGGPRHDELVRTYLRDRFSETPIGAVVAQGAGALCRKRL